MTSPAGGRRDNFEGYASDSPGPTPSPTYRASYFQDVRKQSDDPSISPSSSSPNVTIPALRPRRSSLSLGLDAIRYAGGVNSLDNFARSWTRAAGYFEIAPSRQPVVAVPGSSRDEESPEDSSAIDDDYDEYHSDATTTRGRGRIDGAASSFGSYGSFTSPLSRYGTMDSLPQTGLPIGRLGGAVRHVPEVQDLPASNIGVVPADKEREPLLVKAVVTEEGKVEHVIVGQSTLPQTVFNSVNVLIGIGLLSLPLGLRYSGWLIGIIFILFSAGVTKYTAKLLARCLDKSTNPHLVTYSDIAYIAFGHKSRVCVSVLFSLELMAACVALVVLFADSLHGLFPQIDKLQWKIIAGVVLTPLSFLPLRVLSFSSILGIVSTFSIAMIVFIDGWIKPEAPGSLRDPMPTYLFPQSWWTVPLSFGLLMSPWGGHSVFPNIYKDMRHPKKYNKAVDITYGFTFFLDMALAVTGILMFGDGAADEITYNILALDGYPKGLSVAMVVFIAMIPLTKTPLNSRPIITTIEIMLGVDPRALPEGQRMTPFNEGIMKIVIRIMVNIVFVIVAIQFPSFDRIMAFLGSFLCFTICVILPLLFYLKICAAEISRKERISCWVLLVVSTIFAAIGTVAAFVPKESLGLGVSV